MSYLSPPPTTSDGAAAKVCVNCHSDDRWLLHNVRHRGLDKKLCTCCVLKLHPAAFCPTCFSLHDPNSLHPIPSLTSVSGAGKTLTCFKCSSVSHSTCVPPNAPKSPYLCPPCSNPNFKFFDIRNPAKESGRIQSDGGEQKQFLDERSAKVFLVAARIAAISMNKAVVLARVDVERKVKEAALARKRAKEAIDHVMAISARFAGNKRRETVAIEVPVPALAPPPVPAVPKGPNAVPVKLEKNGVARPINLAPPAAVHMAEKNNMSQLKVEY